jgi:uncharacterized cofD-like protein
VAGRILPSTLDAVALEATLENGSIITGETAIASSRERIRSVALDPAPARPTPGVLEAVREADLVVIGPGSLFTSVIPNLLVDGIGQALRETRATVVLVANVVSEPGETDGLQLVDHLRIIEAHAAGPFVDVVLVHQGSIDPSTLARYEADGACRLEAPVEVPAGVHVLRRPLVATGEKIRHDADRTVEALVLAWRQAQVGQLARGA